MDCDYNKCPAYLLAQQNEKAIDEMDHVNIIARIAVIESKMDQMMKTLATIAEKPSKRWEALVGGFLGAGGVLLAEFILSKG